MEEIKEEEVKQVQTTEDWEEFVKSEVLAALELFLPNSKDGKLGIVYKKTVRENTEAGPVYYENKAEGVEIIISLNFQEVMDKIM